jgi:hypothetical protein
MSERTRLLINRAAVRDKALAVLASRRAHLAAKMTRVGAQFYVDAEAALVRFIEARIESMPSAGKTIR